MGWGTDRSEAPRSEKRYQSRGETDSDAFSSAEGRTNGLSLAPFYLEFWGRGSKLHLAGAVSNWSFVVVEVITVTIEIIIEIF